MSSHTPDIADKLSDEGVSEWHRGVLRTLAAADRPLRFEELIAAHGDNDTSAEWYEIGLQLLHEKGLTIADGAETGETPTWRVNRAKLSSRDLFPRQPVLGRSKDLQDLRERVAQPGFTFVTGPARIGKSTVVRETTGQLADPATSADHGFEKPWLVGYAQSSQSSNGLLTEAVRDLYQRWLDQTSLTDEVKSAVKRYCDQQGSSAARVVRDTLLGVGSVASTAADKGSFALVNTIFGKLRGTHQEIQSGGLSVEPIPYESARDLLKVLEAMSDQPIMLALDAWEQGTTDADRSALRKMADRPDEWPEQMHVMTVIRDTPDNVDLVEYATDMARDHPNADLHSIGPMDLSADADAVGVLNYIYDQVPVTRTENREWVRSNAIYPAVMDEWIHQQPDNLTVLSETAQQGYQSTHQGLLKRLEAVRTSDADAFDAAMRFAVLPEITSEHMAEQLTAVAVGDDGRSAEQMLEKLENWGVLDATDPERPGFGHTTAHEAIGSWVTGDRTTRFRGGSRRQIRRIANEVVDDIAERSNAADGRRPMVYFGGSPRSGFGAMHGQHYTIDPPAIRPIDNLTIPVLASINQRFGQDLLDDRARGLASLASVQAGDIATVASHRLEDLAAAAHDYADDACPAFLANGLFAACTAFAETGDRIPAGTEAAIRQMQELAADHPERSAPRYALCRALSWYAEESARAGDFETANEQLSTLLDIVDEYPEDEMARFVYADTASLALQYESAYSDPHIVRESGHLEELRTLAHDHPFQTRLSAALLIAETTRARLCDDPEAHDMLVEDTAQLVPEETEDERLHSLFVLALNEELQQFSGNVRIDQPMRPGLKIANTLNAIAGGRDHIEGLTIADSGDRPGLPERGTDPIDYGADETGEHGEAPAGEPASPG